MTDLEELRAGVTLLRAVARNGLIVPTTVNGRTLRFLADPLLIGEPLSVVWSDLLSVLGVKFLRRLKMTKILRRKFVDQIKIVRIGGKDELGIPLRWAAAAMAAEPGLPAGLEFELARAAEAAVSRAGEVVLAASPAHGRA